MHSYTYSMCSLNGAHQASADVDIQMLLHLNRNKNYYYHIQLKNTVIECDGESSLIVVAVSDYLNSTNRHPIDKK